MKEGEVRPLAICIFKKMDLILVAEDFDTIKGEGLLDLIVEKCLSDSSADESRGSE